MIYNPNLWKGSYFTEIITEVLESTTLLEKNLVRVIDNVKYEQIVTTLSGDLLDKEYQVLPTYDPSLDTLKFSDTTVKPVKRMIYDEFSMETFRSTRFSEKMAAGAANMDNTEFDNMIINYVGAKWKVAIVKRFLADVVAKAKAQITNVVAEDVTEANVFDVLSEVYAATPDALLADGAKDVHMLLDTSFKKLIMASNSNQEFRDKILKDSDNYYINDLKLVFADLGGKYGIVTRPSDIVLATDLTSDFGSLEIGKKFNYADVLFIKGVYSLDSAIVNSEQKVLLTPATPVAPAVV
jgi:hypothetical protein